MTGYLDKIQFKDGGEVKKGELLFEIDPRPYQTELARTQAALSRPRPTAAGSTTTWSGPRS